MRMEKKTLEYLALVDKRPCEITACYPRQDVDGSILAFTICFKEINAKSEYIYRCDFGPASFEKTFGFKDPSKCNTLVGTKYNVTRVLER